MMLMMCGNYMKRGREIERQIQKVSGLRYSRVKIFILIWTWYKNTHAPSIILCTININIKHILWNQATPEPRRPNHRTSRELTLLCFDSGECLRFAPPTSIITITYLFVTVTAAVAIFWGVDCLNVICDGLRWDQRSYLDSLGKLYWFRCWISYQRYLYWRWMSWTWYSKDLLVWLPTRLNR